MGSRAAGGAGTARREWGVHAAGLSLSAALIHLWVMPEHFEVTSGTVGRINSG